MKRRAAAAVLTVHLLLCVAYVLPDRRGLRDDPLWRPAAVLATWTGAAARYGFFAPGVPSARRLRVRALCGTRWVEVPSPARSGEARLRIETITSLVMHEDVASPVGASWAAYAFGCVPCAEAVLVEIDYYRIPTMAEYRRGDRPEWTLLQVLPFARKS